MGINQRFLRLLQHGGQTTAFMFKSMPLSVSCSVEVLHLPDGINIDTI